MAQQTQTIFSRNRLAQVVVTADDFSTRLVIFHLRGGRYERVGQSHHAFPFAVGVHLARDVARREARRIERRQVTGMAA